MADAICEAEALTSSAFADNSSADAASSSADFCALVDVLSPSARSAIERAASPISLYAFDCSWTDFWASSQPDEDSSDAEAICSAPFKYSRAPATACVALDEITSQLSWMTTMSWAI